MGSTDQLQPIQMIKFIDHFTAENPPRAARAHLPRLDIVGVAPHHVAEGPVVGDLHTTVNQADLVQGLDVGRQPAVNAQDTVRNDGRNGEVV